MEKLRRVRQPCGRLASPRPLQYVEQSDELGMTTAAAGRLSMTGEPQQPDARSCRDVPLDRRDAIIGVGLTLAALTAYAATLAPEWMDSDCAEFYTQAVKLGYAHPTGYPVYLFLAKAATWLPIGQIPCRVNLLSAIAAAAATGLMYLFGRLLTLRRWPPTAGAVALAVSPTFWSQAIIAKVYTSGIVFMLAVLACLELWWQGGRRRGSSPRAALAASAWAST